MKVIRVVAAAWVVDGKVLVARRPHGGPEGGRWEFPGGKVEPGESDVDALRREIAEELDVRVEVGPLVGVSSVVRPTSHLVLVLYLCEGVGRPELRAHVAFDWVRPEALAGIDLAEADVPLVKDLREALDARR